MVKNIPTTIWIVLRKYNIERIWLKIKKNYLLIQVIAHKIFLYYELSITIYSNQILR